MPREPSHELANARSAVERLAQDARTPPARDIGLLAGEGFTMTTFIAKRALSQGSAEPGFVKPARVAAPEVTGRALAPVQARSGPGP